MTVDARLYKELLARWTSGVSIVTTDDNGKPFGLTVSSFMSISLSPPLVAVSITKRLEACEVMRKQKFFAVNVLKPEQLEWGKLFAGMCPDVQDRFANIQYDTLVTGSPILPDTLASMDCKVTRDIEAGDHIIFIGEALSGRWDYEGVPLLYHNRAWGHFAPLPPPAQNQ